MERPVPIQPNTAAFFRKALPGDQATHTLALGEAHFDDVHVRLMTQHMEQLRDEHNLRTIGLEMPAFINLFLWAYRDGTLEKELGSKEAAQAYLKAIFVAYGNKEASNAYTRKAELCMRAFDRGVNVVAFDARDTYAAVKNDRFKELNHFRHGEVERTAKSQNRTVDDFLQYVRETLSKHHHNLPIAWMLDEVKWLSDKKTDYAAKLETIEDLIRLGHTKIAAGKLTSDALSAVIFNALAQPGGRITINGSSHIDGIGMDGFYIKHEFLPKHHVHHMHGTFGHHLFAMGSDDKPPHTVTRAVIAGSAMLPGGDWQGAHPKRIKDDSISGLFPGLDVVTEMDFPHIVNTAVPLDEKFLLENGQYPAFKKQGFMDRLKKKPLEYERPDTIAAHINPLLMPDIKAAADAVRAAMNGPEQGRPR